MNIESPATNSQLNKPASPGRKKNSAKKLQPDWWSKTFAGAVLGFSLVLALSGLFAWIGPGGISAADKAQFNMWIISPLWMLIFSFVYLIPTGRRALFLLGALNLLAYGLLFLVRSVIEGGG